MHSILLKLIFKIAVIFALVFILIPNMSAQDIDENYIFYSPSDNQMGHLTFLNADQKMFSNSNSLLLLGKKTKHLDTLDLSQYNFSGLIQNITVLNDSLFSISTLSEFLKIAIVKNRFSVTEALTKKDLRKRKIVYDQFIFLPEGYLTLKMAVKKDIIIYSVNVYSKNFKKSVEKEIQLFRSKKNSFSNYAISYPHTYYYNEEQIFCFSVKEAKSFVMLNLSSGKLKLIDLSSQSEALEGIEIFYNRADNAYHLVKYTELESDETRLTIYKVNPLTFDNYKLNELVIPLRKVRGGFHQGDILLMDDFKGSLGFYLVPINELHKL